MKSLTLKLVLAFMLIGMIGAGVAAAFSRVATRTEFNRARLQAVQDQFVERVVEYYDIFGSLDGIDEWLRVNRPGAPLDQPPPPPAPLFMLVDQNNRILTRGPGIRQNDIATPQQMLNADAILFEGRRIGAIKYIAGEVGLSDRESQLLNRIYQGLALAALSAALAALVVGVVLARTLTKPARALTAAIHAMSGGQLQQVVKVQSNDELGELSRAFNQMSADIAHEQQLRKQMTADIAHELRTPLTVICGYLDAMNTGTLPITPARLQTVFTQATHLQHLVDDLRTLSLVDANELRLNRQLIAPELLLQQTSQFYEAKAAADQITLQVIAEPNLPHINVDRDRLLQVLGNLVSNALRHTPPYGSITLSAVGKNNGVQLRVQDTGEGIDPDALPHIFERFYRADSARTAASSTGLGLAIVKSIVQAHGGEITVSSTLEAGTAFCIELRVGD